MKLGFEICANVLSAKTIAPLTDAIIENVSIDSRSLHLGPQTLFFALKGPNHDAHRFVPDLINKGVRLFVVEEVPTFIPANVQFLMVNDTLKALQTLAKYYRNLFTFPVLGITGSNGKTIVKEWLSFLMSPEYAIARNPKSFNSQVGVPLSIFGMQESHQFGIFEAGISTQNEMQNLADIIRPQFGILTNIGQAHDDGFLDTNEKISEKLKLFASSNKLVLEYNDKIISLLPQNIQTVTWSFDNNQADYLVQIDKQKDGFSVIKTDNVSAKIPFSDDASVQNAIHCLIFLLQMGYSEQVIAERMPLLFPVEMRLMIKNGMNNTQIIDDSYSNDWQSLQLALDFLENQHQFKHKTIIISDFSPASNVHLWQEKMANLLSKYNIKRIIAIGQNVANWANDFQNSLLYTSTEAFLEKMEDIGFENETILVKGSRNYGFERIVSALEERKHETKLEVNLTALGNNLSYFKSKIRPETKLMAMVKAFGYGNGGFEIAKELEYHKINYLGVAFADEGILLKNKGIRLPIMVLNPESSSYDSIIQYQLEPEIYSLKGLIHFGKLIQAKKIESFPIHIKLDTGMHRLGFLPKDMEILCEHLNKYPQLQVKSILSHLASSDMPEYADFTRNQIQQFVQMTTIIEASLGYSPMKHILNTSGISNFPEAQLDMVRLGIGLYGISNDTQEQFSLENVGTLKSVISQIRPVPRNESIGYGCRFVTQKDSLVATIPIGYADGIRRAWGTKGGYVTINNQKAPIVGSICMDMLMVDVTNVLCNEGDDVVIFGDSPTVIEIAKAVDTIPYEILTSISQRVKRIFFRS